jgi:hypothetical protein
MHFGTHRTFIVFDRTFRPLLVERSILIPTFDKKWIVRVNDRIECLCCYQIDLESDLGRIFEFLMHSGTHRSFIVCDRTFDPCWSNA